MWRKGNCLALLFGMQTGAATVENSMELHQKVKNINTLYASNGITRYPKNTKILLQMFTCTMMFTAALSTIVKLWRHPKCPLTGEWIKKMWCMYTMEYYSAIERMKFCHLQQHGWI